MVDYYWKNSIILTNVDYDMLAEYLVVREIFQCAGEFDFITQETSSLGYDSHFDAEKNEFINSFDVVLAKDLNSFRECCCNI